MINYGKVGVLSGGYSAEREISLMSGKGVLTALRQQGIDAHAFDPAQHTLAELAQQKFDRVFIALHGRYGEDGTLQGALEQLHIPYTGSGVLASALAMNKAMTKYIWQAKGLLTPRFKLLRADSDWAQIVAELGLPLIVKPALEGSSIGLSKVTKLEQLQEAYIKAAQFGEVVAEEFIDGIELTCPLLETAAGQTNALPVVRIEPPDGNFDYQNKYFTNKTRYQCPAELGDAAEQQARALALAAFQALGCRGWGRIDMIQRRSDGAFYLLEMNTAPGMTEHSLMPVSAKEIGLSFSALVMQILACARLELQIEANVAHDLA